MSDSVALQKSVYTALSGDAALAALIQGVYDTPPQRDDPDSNAPFPYVTTSEVSITPWDDDHDAGTEAFVTVHTWSRAQHALEAKDIMDAIYDVLHRGIITISGRAFVGCDMVSQTGPVRDPDGITRHGVQEFRVVYY